MDNGIECSLAVLAKPAMRHVVDGVPGDIAGRGGNGNLGFVHGDFAGHFFLDSKSRRVGIALLVELAGSEVEQEGRKKRDDRKRVCTMSMKMEERKERRKEEKKSAAFLPASGTRTVMFFFIFPYPRAQG